MIEPAFDRFEVANRIFSDALNLSPQARNSFVERACADDVTLRDSVLRLLSRFDQLGDFLEGPAPGLPAPRRFELGLGELLADRFRIVSLIGRGGMGEVYRADDLTLGDPVALKTVRAQWRSDPRALSRFREEVRLARRVSHPNVCRTFDVFTTTMNGEELVFFTMELLDGSSLAEILEATPVLEPARVLSIASGIAQGLDAAHRAGIVHGDLKPGNIVLAHDRQIAERAVITDFGLALVNDAESANGGQSGLIAGSPNYMAPEQFLGEGITSAVDIFAFAVIIYEMISGQRPYPSETLFRAAIRRITQDAQRLNPAAPNAPNGWDATLARALSRDPKKRPVTAEELVRELAAAKPRSALMPSRIGRRSILAALASGAVAVASFFALKRFHSVALPNAPLIMMAPLTSSSPQDARAVQLVIEQSLLQSPHVRVLDESRTAAAWKRMGHSGSLPGDVDARTVREIAMREGAEFVLFGSFDRVADDWKLHLRLELMGDDPSRPRTSFPWSSPDRDQDPALAKAGRAVAWIRTTTGESANDISSHNLPPEALTTKSWPALLEFTAAEEAWRARTPDAQWPPDRRADAELHLKRALELDPQFALASARLADIQVSSDEIDEGLLNYERAAELLDKANLTDRESLRIRGLFDLDTGQYAKAADIFSMWALQYPRDGLPLFYRAGCIARLGNPAASLQLLDKAIQCEPDRYSFILGRAIHLLVAGRFDEARRDCEAAAKLNARDWTDQVRSALAFAALDMSRVFSNLEAMRNAGSVAYRSKAFALEACLRTELNQFDQAEELLRQGLDFDVRNLQPPEARYTKNRLLAQLYLVRNRAPEAITCCKQMLANKPGIRTTLEIGALLARAGDVAGARACVPRGLPKAAPDRAPANLPAGAAPQLRDWPIYWRRVLLLWGEMALREGNAARAFRLIQAAPQSDTPQEWPSALVRASIACGENDEARRWTTALFENPAAYWIVADSNGPGFMRYAIEAARHVGATGPKMERLETFLDSHV